MFGAIPIAMITWLNAFASPLGMLEAGADTYAGQIPTILKVNSANSLMSDGAGKNQAVTASVDDALRLGCSAIGFTIYPGSDMALDMYEEISAMRQEAAAKGVATVIWSYPRGEALSKEWETAFDVTAYAAHIATMLGAQTVNPNIKVKIENQGGGKPHYDKLRNAIQAGSGLPDVAQMEFNSIPSFRALQALADGMLEATVAAMQTPPAQLRAWLGPAAGPADYEIGEEVYHAFVGHDAAAASAFVATRPGHWKVDLFALARQRLQAAGMELGNIHGGTVSTMADADLYSHRRDRRTGRMATLGWMD